MFELTVCPDETCAAHAEIVRRWSWGSTAGAVGHAATRCLTGHYFTVPVEQLPSPSAPVGARF
jgi:hypothetical protein